LRREGAHFLRWDRHVGVTHDFGHLGDVLTRVYSGSQQELSPEKSGIYLLPENIFSK
jgi:hypothetical protein